MLFEPSSIPHTKQFPQAPLIILNSVSVQRHGLLINWPISAWFYLSSMSCISGTILRRAVNTTAPYPSTGSFSQSGSAGTGVSTSSFNSVSLKIGFSSSAPYPTTGSDNAELTSTVGTVAWKSSGGLVPFATGASRSSSHSIPSATGINASSPTNLGSAASNSDVLFSSRSLRPLHRPLDQLLGPLLPLTAVPSVTRLRCQQ